jgi:5'-nucleotidase
LNILISNDDGISSSGIKALESVFKQKHNTFLIAPLKERSATSMALTIFDRMRVEKVLEDHYIVDGYPVDCVNIGLHGGIFPEIDMVLSGINRGVNMGHDVHFSGTVGAARHGAIHGKYSFSISSGKFHNDASYIEEAEVVLELIETKLDFFKKGIVYNINFPIEFSKNINEIQLTKLGKRLYTDTYKTKNIIGGVYDFFLGGSELSYIDTPDSDFHAFYLNQISLTPISLDTTDYTELDRITSDQIFQRE